MVVVDANASTAEMRTAATVVLAPSLNNSITKVFDAAAFASTFVTPVTCAVVKLSAKMTSNEEAAAVDADASLVARLSRFRRSPFSSPNPSVSFEPNPLGSVPLPSFSAGTDTAVEAKPVCLTSKMSVGINPATSTIVTAIFARNKTCSSFDSSSKSTSATVITNAFRSPVVDVVLVAVMDVLLIVVAVDVTDVAVTVVAVRVAVTVDVEVVLVSVAVDVVGHKPHIAGQNVVIDSINAGLVHSAGAKFLQYSSSGSSWQVPCVRVVVDVDVTVCVAVTVVVDVVLPSRLQPHLQEALSNRM